MTNKRLQVLHMAHILGQHTLHSQCYYTVCDMLHQSAAASIPPLPVCLLTHVHATTVHATTVHRL